MQLTSSAFGHGRAIPARYTCEDEDITPPLAWSDVPPGTRSFALVVDDPDAPDPAKPKGTWVHWVVYNLPHTVRSLTEGATLPALARVGMNDWHHQRWGGPCPPVGRHRYFSSSTLSIPCSPNLRQAFPNFWPKWPQPWADLKPVT